MTPNTQHWLDLYSAFVEALIRDLSDPKEWFERLNITPGAPGVMALPRTADPAAVQELRDSWARVRRDIRTFGLELGENLELAPDILSPDMLNGLQGQALVRLKAELEKWGRDPWLEVCHRFEVVPVRFKGRDALTALGFFTHWINQCNKVDPLEETKKVLLKQGINAENFHEHADRLMIKNPWASDSPEPPSSTVPSRN